MISMSQVFGTSKSAHKVSSRSVSSCVTEIAPTGGVAATANTLTPVVGKTVCTFYCSVAGVFRITLGLNGVAALEPSEANTPRGNGILIPLIAGHTVMFMSEDSADLITSLSYKSTTITGTVYVNFFNA